MVGVPLSCSRAKRPLHADVLDLRWLVIDALQDLVHEPSDCFGVFLMRFPLVMPLSSVVGAGSPSGVGVRSGGGGLEKDFGCGGACIEDGPAGAVGADQARVT